MQKNKKCDKIKKVATIESFECKLFRKGKHILIVIFCYLVNKYNRRAYYE